MKITGLPARAAVALTDIMAIVDAAGGVPATWKATVAQVRAVLMPIVLTVDVLGLLPLANLAAPTGTGVIKGVAGAWGAAASLIVDADVATGAAVAVAKLAPGANTQVLTTTAGVTVWAAAPGGGTVPTGTGFTHITAGAQDAASKKVDLTAAADVTVPATANGVVTSSGTALQTATNVLAGTSFVSIGATPATSGLVRMDGLAAGALVSYQDGGTTYKLLSNPGATTTFGEAGRNSEMIGNSSYYTVQLGHAHNFYVTSTMLLSLDTTTGIQAALPITGYAASSSPYGVHGVGTQAMPVGVTATTTLAAAVYRFNTIKTTGALTANQNLVFPAAADAAGYTKVINNACTGAFSIIVGDGGLGTTVTVGLGGTTTVLFDSRGATQVGVGFAAAGGTPAGTGFSHTTVGVLDASSKKVDLTAAADVTVPATANGVVTSSGTALQQAANVTAASGSIGISDGTTIASTGSVAFSKTSSIKFRNSTNASDMVAMLSDGTDQLFLGSDAAFGSRTFYTYVRAAIGLYAGVGNVDTMRWTSTEVGSLNPIVGYASPYGVHGGVAVSVTATPQALVASQYSLDTIKLSTTTAAAFTVTVPAPASLAVGYYKNYWNTSAFAATISTGVGTTRTIPATQGQRMWHDNSGVSNAGPSFTP